MKPLHELTITEASALLAEKKITSVDLTRACLEQIKKTDDDIHAFLEVFDDALAQAQAADTRRQAQGEQASPLLGIPLAVKDNILIKGKRASAASKMLENYVATYDATVIARLREAGAVFIGRTNMDEFAMGGSTENSAFGPTKNPHDLSRVPGGSSGGSAAAVAGNMALGALGTDTGGSVREPAAFCGIVGFKPTYGEVSRSGLIAMGSSLDQWGPMTKSVADAELLFNAVRGNDPLDSTSLKDAYTPRAAGKKIGIPMNIMGGLDSDVMDNFVAAQKRFKDAGYEIVTIDLPLLKKVLSIYYIVMFAESSTNLSRFDGVRYGLSKEGSDLVGDYAASRAAGFGPEVRRRILLGTYVLSSGYYDAYYGKATAARKQLIEDFNRIFADIDFVLTPTTPTPAFRIGEKSDPLSMYLTDIFTVTANLTGMPALSVPSGSVEKDGKQLPLGIHLTAPHGADDALLLAAKTFMGEVK
jgi:aspartyl-tRNA(Asn)/glutamyl-tRNA(Gln) amidotransferase subunit A